VTNNATPRQGEIWWAEAQDKRRPVLVVTRSEAVEVLHWIVVAPITRTVRRIPTEVALGEREGLRVDCAASFDNLQPIRRSFLTVRVGQLGAESRHEICRALAALADC
jgi:mRNA interferase MazF